MMAKNGKDGIPKNLTASSPQSSEASKGYKLAMIKENVLARKRNNRNGDVISSALDVFDDKRSSMEDNDVMRKIKKEVTLSVTLDPHLLVTSTSKMGKAEVNSLNVKEMKEKVAEIGFVVKDFKENVQELKMKCIEELEMKVREFTKLVEVNKKVLEKKIRVFESFKKMEERQSFVIKPKEKGGSTEFTPLIVKCSDCLEVIFGFLDTMSLLDNVSLSCSMFWAFVRKRCRLSLTLNLIPQNLLFKQNRSSISSLIYLIKNYRFRMIVLHSSFFHQSQGKDIESDMLLPEFSSPLDLILSVIKRNSSCLECLEFVKSAYGRSPATFDKKGVDSALRIFRELKKTSVRIVDLSFLSSDMTYSRKLLHNDFSHLSEICVDATSNGLVVLMLFLTAYGDQIRSIEIKPVNFSVVKMGGVYSQSLKKECENLLLGKIVKLKKLKKLRMIIFPSSGFPKSVSDLFLNQLTSLTLDIHISLDRTIGRRSRGRGRGRGRHLIRFQQHSRELYTQRDSSGGGIAYLDDVDLTDRTERKTPKVIPKSETVSKYEKELLMNFFETLIQKKQKSLKSVSFVFHGFPLVNDPWHAWVKCLEVPDSCCKFISMEMNPLQSRFLMNPLFKKFELKSKSVSLKEIRAKEIVICSSKTLLDPSYLDLARSLLFFPKIKNVELFYVSEIKEIEKLLVPLLLSSDNTELCCLRIGVCTFPHSGDHLVSKYFINLLGLLVSKVIFKELVFFSQSPELGTKSELKSQKFEKDLDSLCEMLVKSNPSIKFRLFEGRTNDYIQKKMLLLILSRKLHEKK